MEGGQWLPPQHHASDYEPGMPCYVRNPYPTTDKAHWAKVGHGGGGAAPGARGSVAMAVRPLWVPARVTARSGARVTAMTTWEPRVPCVAHFAALRPRNGGGVDGEQQLLHEATSAAAPAPAAPSSAGAHAGGREDEVETALVSEVGDRCLNVVERRSEGGGVDLSPSISHWRSRSLSVSRLDARRSPRHTTA